MDEEKPDPTPLRLDRPTLECDSAEGARRTWLLDDVPGLIVRMLGRLPERDEETPLCRPCDEGRPLVALIVPDRPKPRVAEPLRRDDDRLRLVNRDDEAELRPAERPFVGGLVARCVDRPRVENERVLLAVDPMDRAGAERRVAGRDRVTLGRLLRNDREADDRERAEERDRIDDLDDLTLRVAGLLDPRDIDRPDPRFRGGPA